MTNVHCKAVPKLGEVWTDHSSARPKKPLPNAVSLWPCLERRKLPSERDFSSLCLCPGAGKSYPAAAKRLKVRLSELIETLGRLRLLEALICEMNKTMSVDDTMTPEVDGYRVFRNGVVPLEVLGNLARYEAHLVREIEAIASLLRPQDRERGRRRAEPE